MYIKISYFCRIRNLPHKLQKKPQKKHGLWCHHLRRTTARRWNMWSTSLDLGRLPCQVRHGGWPGGNAKHKRTSQNLEWNIGFYHGKMWISSQKHRILSANMSNSTKNMGEVTLWDVANVMIPAANRLMWNLTIAISSNHLWGFIFEIACEI